MTSRRLNAATPQVAISSGWREISRHPLLVSARRAIPRPSRAGGTLALLLHNLLDEMRDGVLGGVANQEVCGLLGLWRRARDRVGVRHLFEERHVVFRVSDESDLV